MKAPSPRKYQYTWMDRLRHRPLSRSITDVLILLAISICFLICCGVFYYCSYHLLSHFKGDLSKWDLKRIKAKRLLHLCPDPASAVAVTATTQDESLLSCTEIKKWSSVNVYAEAIQSTISHAYSHIKPDSFWCYSGSSCRMILDNFLHSLLSWTGPIILASLFVSMMLLWVLMDRAKTRAMTVQQTIRDMEYMRPNHMKMLTHDQSPPILDLTSILSHTYNAGPVKTKFT